MWGWGGGGVEEEKGGGREANGRQPRQRREAALMSDNLTPQPPLQLPLTTQSVFMLTVRLAPVRAVSAARGDHARCHSPDLFPLHSFVLV